jgi:hypothetical protein
MSKTVPLNNAIAVVKSAEKLPATLPKREYADFDAFVENADIVHDFFARIYSFTQERLIDADDWFEWIEWHDNKYLDLKEAGKKIATAKYTVESARHALSDFPWGRKCLAKYKRDEKWYNRKELYEIKGRGKREKWTLSRRVVSEQIALLLASFQNARPGTPKVFARMLTEEIYAKNPNACVLESACRQVRREKDFPPSIAEVLKAVKQEGNAWCERWEILDECDADQLQQELEEAIANAEAIIAKAEAKFAEREAREKAAEEKRKAYCEAYERIPIDERRAFEDGRRDRSRNQSGYPQWSTPGYLAEGPLAQAYEAGLTGKEIPGLELKTNGAAGGV